MEEGINFVELVSPKKILGENGRVKGTELIKMELGKLDKTGRPKPEEIKGSEFVMNFDTIVIALGTKPNRLFLSQARGIKTTEQNEIVVDKNLKTNITSVFAGGDVIGGRATVIQALGEGKKAAISINEYLSEN